MKLYITFGPAHVEPNAKRGLTVSTNGWWEVMAPNYQVAHAIAWAAFDGVFAFDYTEENWDPKWYPIGCMGTITVGNEKAGWFAGAVGAAGAVATSDIGFTVRAEAIKRIAEGMGIPVELLETNPTGDEEE